MSTSCMGIPAQVMLAWQRSNALGPQRTHRAQSAKRSDRWARENCTACDGACNVSLHDERNAVPDRKPVAAGADQLGGASARSEEHTSELQSLMRISYAVFCLKKKKT